MTIKECKKHGLVKFYLFKDGRERLRYRCSKCAVEAVNKRRRMLKLKAIEHLGGKCIKCGYSKCPAALEFHHTEDFKKDFQISSLKAWSKVIEELKKCILLCSNCHMEIHWENQT